MSTYIIIDGSARAGHLLADTSTGNAGMAYTLQVLLAGLCCLVAPGKEGYGQHCPAPGLEKLLARQHLPQWLQRVRREVMRAINLYGYHLSCKWQG